MGMSIDKCIEKITHEKQCFIDECWHNNGELEAYDMAIEIMRKYQQIQEIYERFKKDGGYLPRMAWIGVMEVVEDGKS